MITMLHDVTIQLQGSILGFEGHNEYRIDVIEENDQFANLQSIEDPNISFLVTSPFSFHEQYVFELEESIKSTLQVESQEEVAVLAIVTIHEKFMESTMNLLAPIVINTKSLIGRQIVLPPDSGYKTSEPLFAPISKESGE
ncbi:flagellar assembly protein FliW [Paenibacillus alba]|uniref:flagellar assembly protein FliW n=1 Tax=Paenibacillus alba TaxID=1197127 RepID=UPI0015631944|nr:flagellar assembly protein FliW [Paenibacillus alba]NQX70114.1 flagellar assembly protein FliW [Paenibacillus alba]